MVAGVRGVLAIRISDASIASKTTDLLFTLGAVDGKEHVLQN